MANTKVFQRNLNVRTDVPRSVQQLNSSKSFVTRFGQIVPVQAWQMYPHETIRVNLTNFIRTIPLKTPPLSNIKVYTRFVAVPNRIMWRPFEDYIDPMSEKDYGDELVEPYVCNFNSIREFYRGDEVLNLDSHVTFCATRRSDFLNWDAAVQSMIENISASDLSPLGVGRCVVADWSGEGTVSISPSWLNQYARCMRIDSDRHYPVALPSSPIAGYQFFPRELGDYFGYPIYSAHNSKLDVSSRISAWKMCAYQMAYSYTYRRPNVEEAVDDFYEMQKLYNDAPFAEFGSFFTYFQNKSYRTVSSLSNDTSFIPPISLYNRFVAGENYYPSDVKPAGVVNPPAIRSVGGYDITDTALSPSRFNSWKSVEKFPLRNGANFTLNGESLYGDSLQQHETTISLTRMRFAPWSLDRFTSSNPWQQRGDEALIGVNGWSYVYVKNHDGNLFPLNTASLSVTPGGQTSALTFGMSIDGRANDNAFVTSSDREALELLIPEANSHFYVTPSNFRFAMQLQKIKEMSARTDGRYKSFLNMFYGANPADYRLDRPEVIGGFVQTLNISEIAQTSPTSDGSSPLGTLAGRGISAKRSSTITFHANEHTVVLALMHIMPEVIYTGGLYREDNTVNPYDWAMPQFAGLSEEPIFNKELAVLSTSFNVGTNSNINNAAFGYEPRYNYLRASHNEAVTDFRDVLNSTGNYEYYKPWLITRNFGYIEYPSVPASYDFNVYMSKLSPNVPTLSSAFLSTRHTVDNDMFEVTDETTMYPFLCDSFAQVRWTRIIPEIGIPRI